MSFAIGRSSAAALRHYSPIAADARSP